MQKPYISGEIALDFALSYQELQEAATAKRLADSKHEAAKKKFSEAQLALGTGVSMRERAELKRDELPGDQRIAPRPQKAFKTIDRVPYEEVQV